MTTVAAAPPRGVPRSFAERIRRAPTPSRLRGLMVGAWLLAGLLFVIGAPMLYGAWSAIRTVGKDTAPSIIAAQEISSALADLDANAGNYLLGTRQHQQDALATFEKQRVVVTKSLVKAANNITYGEAESVPINALFDGLGRYLELYAEMRYRKDSGDAAGALSVYTNATALMHEGMLPAASDLDKANDHYLKTEYGTQMDRAEIALVSVAIVAGALAVLLVWAQVFLYRRMRRIVNVPLLAATLVTLGFGAYLVGTVANSREDLRVAKQDAFESIHALWQARAVAYDANGDETRYLLDTKRSRSFDQAFRDKVKKLTTVPQADGELLASRDVPKRYQGYFADELRNITFRGEREAAVKMIGAFADYARIDGKIRALELSGKHDDAVELCIGSRSDESNAAFERFDEALQRVIAINHQEFDATVDAGERALVVAGAALPVACLLVAFLALFGIRPRLREYAA